MILYTKIYIYSIQYFESLPFLVFEVILLIFLGIKNYFKFIQI